MEKYLPLKKGAMQGSHNNLHRRLDNWIELLYRTTNILNGVSFKLICTVWNQSNKKLTESCQLSSSVYFTKSGFYPCFNLMGTENKPKPACKLPTLKRKKMENTAAFVFSYVQIYKYLDYPNKVNQNSFGIIWLVEQHLHITEPTSEILLHMKLLNLKMFKLFTQKSILSLKKMYFFLLFSQSLSRKGHGHWSAMSLLGILTI